MKSKHYRNHLRLALAGLLLAETFFSHSVLAKQLGDTKNFSFTGVMIQATPCAINGDQPVTVTFGNVGISKIDSGKYVRDLNYNLNCGGATSTNKVTLFIKANSVSWNPRAIATNVVGLGVEILNNGSPIDINSGLDVPDPLNPPLLQVLLVRDPKETLTEQSFNATGTLIADYI